MLFQVPHWGFQRVHGADLEPALIRRLIDDCPNVAAIKAEGGMPSTMGFVECHRLFGREVVISCPLEKDMIPFAQLVPTQLSGTSNTEYFGNTIPRIFDLVQKGEFDEASRLYWQIQPACRANQASPPLICDTSVLKVVEQQSRRTGLPNQICHQSSTEFREAFPPKGPSCNCQSRNCISVLAMAPENAVPQIQEHRLISRLRMRFAPTSCRS